MGFIKKIYRPALRLLSKNGFAAQSNAARWSFALAPEVYRTSSGTFISRTGDYDYNYVSVLGCWSQTVKPSGTRASSRITQLYASNVQNGVTTQVTAPPPANHYYAVPESDEDSEYYESVGALSSSMSTSPATVRSFLNNNFWASQLNWGDSVGGNGLMPLTWQLPISAWCNYMYTHNHRNGGLRVMFECMMGACKKADDWSIAPLCILRNAARFKNDEYSLLSTVVNPSATKTFTPNKEYGSYSYIQYLRYNAIYDVEYFDDNYGYYEDLFLTPAIDSDPSGTQAQFQCGPITCKITVTGIDT